MKFLQPAGLLLILALVVIFFFPRHLPDAAKPFRRRMRVFRENGELVRSTRDASGSEEHSGGQDGESPDSVDESAS